LLSEIEKPQGIKCATFGASGFNKSDIAVGDFAGNLMIIDLEKQATVFTAKAHSSMINAIDAIGGTEVGCGAAEIVTGGRDGCIRVWDPRQPTAVLALEPADKDAIIPDCWAVGFGNSYNNEERCLVGGYDNGDIKIFDLRKNMLQWDTNLKNGICGLEFDRKDIMMNKLVATTLEGKMHVMDMRTYHHEHGYASLVETPVKATVWGVKHLPQNRDIFAIQGGNGALVLYKYNYPSQRSVEASDNKPRGIIGNVEKLNEKEIATQPISSFDWNKDKLGLGVGCALDQQVKVVLVTKLNLF